jgi:hypothetical protein
VKWTDQDTRNRYVALKPAHRAVRLHRRGRRPRSHERPDLHRHLPAGRPGLELALPGDPLGPAPTALRPLARPTRFRGAPRSR